MVCLSVELRFDHRCEVEILEPRVYEYLVFTRLEGFKSLAASTSIASHPITHLWFAISSFTTTFTNVYRKI